MRWIALDVITVPDPLTVDLTSLQYLSEASEHLLHRLFFTDGNLSQLRWCLSERNRARQDVARKTAASARTDLPPQNQDELHTEIGEDRVSELQSLTDSLYALVEVCRKSTNGAFSALLSALEAKFGQDFVWTEPPCESFASVDFSELRT
ncbi:MAG: hypothetical protein IH936_07760 [Acidobacteria bacterium]|nr:hypothetical protein [Acidobacteriota bacterium]